MTERVNDTEERIEIRGEQNKERTRKGMEEG
jgi:hypothetical protein